MDVFECNLNLIYWGNARQPLFIKCKQKAQFKSNLIRQNMYFATVTCCLLI